MAKYNGWKNYETWKLAVEIENTEHLYNMVKEIVRKEQHYKAVRKKLRVLFPNAEKTVSFTEIAEDFLASLTMDELEKQEIKPDDLTKEMLISKRVFPIDMETYFKDFLNENHKMVKVLGYDYGVGSVLLKIDPTAFRFEMVAHLDCEKSNGNILEVDGLFFWIQEIEKHFELKD